MPTAISAPTLFPTLTPEYILSFQFSSWFPIFFRLSIRSTIIRPLSQEFCEYLDSDGVMVPEGSEDLFVWFSVLAWTKRREPNFVRPVESTLSDDGEEEGEDAEEGQRYTFPMLDAQIRQVIKEYGSVFPKLNFSSPKVGFSHFIICISGLLKFAIGCILDITCIFALKVYMSCRCLSSPQVFRLCIPRSQQRYSLWRLWIPVSSFISSIWARACPPQVVLCGPQQRVQMFCPSERSPR